MRSHHSHQGDGHSGTAHVDGRAQGDGHGVVVLVQAQLLAQLHVHRDVSRGAAGEKRRNAGVLRATPHQRIGVLAEARKRQKRIGHEGDHGHGGKEHQQKLTVLGEDLKAVGADRGVHQAHDAERSQGDDPTHDLRNRVGDRGEDLLHAVLGMTQGNAEQHGPRKDTQVIRVGQGINGVGGDGQQKFGEHRPDIGRSRRGVLRCGQGKLYGEQGAHQNGDERRDERSSQIQDHDNLHGTGALGVCKRADDQEEYQDGRHALQCGDEQRAEHLEHVVTRPKHAQDSADDQTDENTLDQADVVPLPPDRLQCFHTIRSFPPALPRNRESKLQHKAAEGNMHACMLPSNGAGERT